MKLQFLCCCLKKGTFNYDEHLLFLCDVATCLTCVPHRCSVLEPGRTLTLAEKGGTGAEEVVAAAGFRLVATMNPGGDYGKRELSPALANRFTTIWVPPIEDEAELAQILNARLSGAPLSTAALFSPLH